MDDFEVETGLIYNWENPLPNFAVIAALLTGAKGLVKLAASLLQQFSVVYFAVALCVAVAKRLSLSSYMVYLLKDASAHQSNPIFP